MLFTTFFATLLSFSALAQTSTKCDFEVKCESFKLTFKSSSGECVEDDSLVSLTTSSNPTPRKLNLTPAWFYEMYNVGNLKSQCSSTNYKSYPSFDFGKQKLILLRSNARPGFDQLQAILLDTKSGNLVHNLDLGRYMRNTLGVLKTKKGFKLQMIKGNLQQMDCDCDAAILEGWMEVRVVKNKITKNWL